MEKIEKLIETYFKGGSCIWPITADATRKYHDGEFYVRQSFRGGKLTVSVGDDNGELVLMESSDDERLEALLKVLMWGL